MKANIGTATLKPSQVISPAHPPITVNRAVLEDNGVIADGQIVAMDEDGKTIPHALVEDLAMTGTINGTNKVFTAAIGPYLPGSIVISNDNETAQEVTDDENGGLVGDGAGTVLPDGTVSVTLGTAPAEGKTVTISYKTKPVGVNVVECDTAEDDSTVVIEHGAVNRDLLLRGAVAADDQDVEALKAIGIYAV